MNMYVWTDCVNRDYTAGDLCVMADSLRGARRMAKLAHARGEFDIDGPPPWNEAPDKVLSGDVAVHASYGGG